MTQRKKNRGGGSRDGDRYAPTHTQRAPRQGQGIHRLEPMGRDALRDAALQQIGKRGAAEYVEEPAIGMPEKARQEHVTEEQRSREKAKAERSKRQKKRARSPRRDKPPADPRRVLAGLIAGVAIGGLLLAGWFVFLLDTVEIIGNERYPSESIYSLTGLIPGQHMLLCDISAAQEGIESNPYLKVQSIARIWPRTIRIEVAEREEAAVIHTLDTDVIIDITGHVLSIGSGSDLSHLVRVIGVPLTGFQVNQSIAGDADFQTQTLFSLLDGLVEHELLLDIAVADISNPLHAWLQTRDGIQVILGQPTELSEKLGWMRDALPSLRQSGITTGTLDVSAKGGAIWSPPSNSISAEQDAATQEQGEQGEQGAPDEQSDEPADEQSGEPAESQDNADEG